MFDKPKRKRKKKKSGQRPRWQMRIVYGLLLIAVSVGGYAYILESRPTQMTVQTIQERDLPERTPVFSEQTRNLSGGSDTPGSTLHSADDSTTTQRLSGEALNGLANSATSWRVNPLHDGSMLCDVYSTLSRCQK